MSAETLHKQLQRAIRQGELSTIARICVSNPKAPALLVSRDFTGNCPIHYAALHGHVDLMKLLVKMGADVDKENEYGWTALMLAAYHGHTPVVDFLIHVKSVNADKVNILGLSALKCAIYQRQEGATQLLLDRGVELNEGGADGLGLTPLMIACHVKNHSAVSCLLHSGADCNYQSKSNGWTALFYAIHPDDYSLVKILLNARAEPKLQDWMGRTAISYAKEMGCDLEALFGASSSGPSAPGGSGLQKVTDGFMGLKFTKGLERQSTSESMQSGRPTSSTFSRQSMKPNFLFQSMDRTDSSDRITAASPLFQHFRSNSQDARGSTSQSPLRQSPMSPTGVPRSAARARGMSQSQSPSSLDPTGSMLSVDSSPNNSFIKGEEPDATRRTSWWSTLGKK